MKNRAVIYFLGLFMALGLVADDPFFLIRTPAQMEDAQAFEMKRDLFRYTSTAQAIPGLTEGEPPTLAQTQTEALAAAVKENPLASAGMPVFDVVLLGTILRQNKRCALLSINGEIEVVDEGEDLSNGWHIEKISTTRVTVKTAQSSMMLALEGEEHE